MSIQETIARFNSLHKAERDALDTLGLDPSTIDTYLKTAGESNRFFAENWPLVSTELKRLQAQNDYMFAALELTEGRLKDKEATIEKARDALQTASKVGSNYSSEFIIAVRDKAHEALAALDGLASDAGDGWISVKDRLPEYGVEVETLFQYARSVSGPFIAKNTFHEWTDIDGTKRLGWSYTPGNPTHWRYAPAWPAAPKGGE